jgi:hypothetical protein
MDVHESWILSERLGGCVGVLFVVASFFLLFCCQGESVGGGVEDRSDLVAILPNNCVLLLTSCAYRWQCNRFSIMENSDGWPSLPMLRACDV